MTDGPFFSDSKDGKKEEVEESDKLFPEEEEYSDDDVEYAEDEYDDFPEDEGEPLPELDTLPTLSESDPFFDLTEEDKPTIPWLIIAIVAGVIGLGVAGWYLYDGSTAPSGEARFVKADTGPIKTRPDDPGGMQFPHEDKLVYNEVGGDPAPQDERLGPEAEQPMARPAPEPAPAPVPEPVPEPVVVPAPAPAPAPVAEEPVLPPLPPRASDPEPAPAPVYEPAPAYVAEAQPEPAPVAEEPPSAYTEPDPVKDFAPEPKPVPVPVEDQYGAPLAEPSYPAASGYDWDNSFVLQLGAFSSRQRAEAAWATYREGNEDVLVGARSNVRAKTTSAGIEVYALRAGPYRTRADAVTVRDALKDRGVDSFVVAP